MQNFGWCHLDSQHFSQRLIQAHEAQHSSSPAICLSSLSSPVYPVFQTPLSIIKLTMPSQCVQSLADHQDESGGASDIDCSSGWVTVSGDRPSPACLPCCHSFSACPWSTTTYSVCCMWDSAAHSQGSAAGLQAVWGCLTANVMLGCSYVRWHGFAKTRCVQCSSLHLISVI